MTSHHVYFGATGLPAGWVLILLFICVSWMVPTPVVLERGTHRHAPELTPRKETVSAAAGSAPEGGPAVRKQTSGSPAPARSSQVCPRPLSFCPGSPRGTPRVPQSL